MSSLSHTRLCKIRAGGSRRELRLRPLDILIYSSVIRHDTSRALAFSQQHHFPLAYRLLFIPRGFSQNAFIIKRDFAGIISIWLTLRLWRFILMEFEPLFSAFTWHTGLSVTIYCNSGISVAFLPTYIYPYQRRPCHRAHEIDSGWYISSRLFHLVPATSKCIASLFATRPCQCLSTPLFLPLIVFIHHCKHFAYIISGNCRQFMLVTISAMLPDIRQKCTEII